MAEERIDDIISQEAFEQVRKLAQELVALNEVMSGTIREAQGLKDAMSQATSFKETVSVMNQANGVVEQYVKTSSERLNVERQIKAEGEKMVKVLQDEEMQLDKAIIAMNRKRKSSEDLAAGVVKVEMALESQKKKLKDVKEEIKENGRINDEQKAKLAELTTTIGELNVRRSEMMRQLKEDANLTQGTGDSYRAMNAQLVMLRNAYKSLSEEERNAVDIGGAMRDAINSLDERLKSIDKTIGQNQRNVGNYEVVLEKVLGGEMNMRKALGMLSRELTNQEVQRRVLGQTIEQQEAKVQKLLQTEGAESETYKAEAKSLEEMKTRYTDMGNAINDLTQKTGFLKDTQADVQTSVKNAAMDAGGIKAAVEGVSLITQSYNALNAVMAVSGADSQKLADIFNRMMIIQNGVNAINKIALALQKESILRLKIREAIDKARLLYIKANTSATATETVSEKANTNAKVENAAATSGVTAATSAMAAGEAVATTASFTLVGALKAVGLAIKSIPVIGWILAAISALTTLTVLVYKHLSAEKELTAEQMRRKEVQDGINEAEKEAFSNTEKEAMELDRSVEKIHSLKEGTVEYNDELKKVADKLGVSEKWLSKNISKVDSLAAAWKRVRYAQALTDALLSKAADAQVKSEEKIIELRDKSYKERKKQLREDGYSRREAKRMAQQQNMLETENRIRKQGAATANDFQKAADTAEKEVEKDIQEVLTAQKEGSKESEKTTKNSIDKQKKERESAKEYYKGVLKQLADYEDKSMTKTVRGRISKLEEQKAKELGKYKLTAEEKVKVEELYAKKIQEITDEENRRVQMSVAAAYAVTAEQQMKMFELNAKMAGKSGEELTTILLEIEKRRYELESSNREQAFKKETKDVLEHSEEWYAIRNKYNSMQELAERQHQQKMGEIRKSGIDGELKKISESYSRMLNLMVVERNGVAPTELERMRMDAQMAQEQLEKFSDMTYPLDTLQRELDAGLLSETEYAEGYKSILEELGMTEEEYFNKRAQMQADALEKQQKFSQAQKDAILSAVNSIVNSFNSIGESMKQLTGDSIGMTYAMQAVSMAQVLMNQGVAISAAIEKAMSDKTTENVVAAIAAALAGVAAVISQIASAKSAIEQSRQELDKASAYAEGTDYHHGGDAIVGEGGVPEIVTANGKSYVIDKPTLIRDLPVGSKVTPVEEMPGTGTDLSEIIDAMGRIERKDRVQINVGKDVYSYIVGGATRARILNRQFCH